MKRDYNSMDFTPEEVKQGLHKKLLDYLFGYNEKSKKHYCDIHVTTDGYCTTIEWDCVPYSGEWGGRFQYIGENQEVGTWVELPDNSRHLVFSEEEAQEVLEDYKKNLDKGEE